MASKHDITVKQVIDTINDGVNKGYITEDDRTRMMNTPIYSLSDLKAIELEAVGKIMDGTHADELDAALLRETA